MKSLDSFLFELRQQGVTLWLEDDRLRYRSPEGAISPDLMSELKARKAQILSFLQQVNSTATANHPPLVPIAATEPASLSFAQQRFWLLHQFEPNSSAHNMPVILRLTGQLNLPALEQSLTEVVRRHQILRTTFPLVDGEPRQVISPAVDISIPTVDLRSVPAAGRDAEALRLATAAAQTPFNLTAGPMLHVRLFHLAEQEYLFLWSIHCITGDGSSSDIFYQELTSLYAAFSAGQPSPLPELPIQYADFAQWQRNWLQGEALEKQLEYWKRQLGGSLSAIQLPTDHPRPPVQTFRGDRCARMFSQKLHGDLVKLSQQTGTTLFMVLLAAFETLLFRYSDQEDLLISFTNAGRNQVETENLIGFFSGTLLLRANFAGNPSFRALLHQVREESLEAYAHQDLPFEKLVEELRPEQNQSRSPLFQIKFALNPPWTNGRGMSSVYLPDLSIESLFGYIYHGETKFDLILVMREQEQGLGAVFDYNADLFERHTAERMMEHFQILLEAIVANPDQTVLELPLLPPAERVQQNPVFYPRDCSIQQVFSAQAENTPGAVALVTADSQLTYRELDQRSDRLAAYLQASGISTGTPVAIFLERSSLLVTALLAVLKAGGLYLPLDPLAAPEDCATILADAQVSIVLTQQSLAEAAEAIASAAICLDAETLAEASLETKISAVSTGWVDANSIACIRYDSPTSGQHKGLQISHRGIVHLAKGGNYAALTSDRLFLHHSSLMQPASAFEIWGSLLNGATLVLAPTAPLSTAELADLIQSHAITTLWLPTRLFHRLADHHFTALKSVRQLLTGGDLLSVPQVQTLLQDLPTCQLLYVYSAPGSTAFTCCYPISQRSQLSQLNTAIPIGQPLDHVQIYLLNRQRQPVPIGVPGELYVGGDGLAQGYVNQPDLTAQHFIPHPDSSAPMLYRTGDLVRRLPDGNLEWIGAAERLIKIQNWRVELGRIETLLSQHAAVREALVITHYDLPRNECLVAYVVLLPEQTATGTALRSHLRQQLPLLMVPSHFVFLDAIPLNPWGSVNAAALPFPCFGTDLIPAAPPTDQIERQLTQIWAELFGIQAIGLQDNFFDLGGDSLLAVRLFAKLEQVFSQKLPLAVLLAAPTIEQLAAVLRQEDTDDLWSPLVPIQPGDPSKLPLFCVHGMGFNVLIYRDLAAHLGSEQPVYGLQARGLDGSKDRISDHLEAIAADYIQQVQIVQPRGPYLLAGLSNGGNIALEMAQQLLAQGQEVGFIAMFDTFKSNSVKLMAPWPRFLSSLKYLLRFSTHRFIVKSWQDPSVLLAKAGKVSSFFSARSAAPQFEAPAKADVPVVRSNPIYRWMDRLSQYVIDHSTWSFLPQHLLREAGSASQTIQEMEAVYSKIQAAYEPSVYPGRIILFQAGESPPGYEVEPLLGWGDIAQAGVEVHKIPGNHTSIVASLLLADKLKGYIEAVERANHPVVSANNIRER